MIRVLTQPRLLGLLLSSTSTLFVGMSLFPLFPHLAAELGAGPGATGAALAIIYVANALGPSVPALLAGRVRRKLLFVAAGIAGPPSIALLGRATALWQAVALMAIAWFCGGIILALVHVFTGIYAPAPIRGRAYALMALATPLGGLLGGATMTTLLARFDFFVGCLGLAAVWAILPLVGLLTLDRRAEQGRLATRAERRGGAGPSQAFWLVLAASLLANVAISTSRLGSALLMQTRALPAVQVATTAAVSGVAAIPLIVLFGVLGDRLGRRQAFRLSAVLVVGGAAIHIGATAPWQFWLGATLLLAAFSTTSALGAALTADSVGAATLGGAMARYTSTGSVAGVFSFAVTGYLYALAGPAVLFTASAALGLGAAVLVGWLGRGQRASSVAPELAAAVE